VLFGLHVGIVALTYAAIFKLFYDQVSVLQRVEKHFNSNDVVFFVVFLPLSKALISS